MPSNERNPDPGNEKKPGFLAEVFETPVPEKIGIFSWKATLSPNYDTPVSFTNMKLILLKMLP